MWAAMSGARRLRTVRHASRVLAAPIKPANNSRTFEKTAELRWRPAAVNPLGLSAWEGLSSSCQGLSSGFRCRRNVAVSSWRLRMKKRLRRITARYGDTDPDTPPDPRVRRIRPSVSVIA